MSLNLRQKQTATIVRMLNLNNPPNSNNSSSSTDSSTEVYKVLILDRFCRDVLSPLIHVRDLRSHGITLYFLIDKTNRQPIPDVPAIYFLSPTSPNLSLLSDDLSKSLYSSFHLNFSSPLPRSLLETLASASLASSSTHLISRIFDQYSNFITLEDSLFSLAQPKTYVNLNDPAAGEAEVTSVVDEIVSGLFSVLVTLSVVPVIRAPRDGPAAMVAEALDSRIRDHLLSKNNLFSESTATSFQRPVLCIFDRNFELAVGVQHDWTYRPLVHDLLSLKLNRVAVDGGKSYELDSADPFWSANGWLPFPKVAEEIETQLAKYKADVDEVNKRTGGKDGAEFDGTDLIGNTKHLMSAVNSLPELTERKKVIDKHTNIATVLLGKIKERSLDTYCTLEDDMLTKGSVDRSSLVGLIRGKGTKEDKIRLAVTYLLSMETTPHSEVEAIETALREAEVDTCAFQYVRKIKSLNSSLASSMSSASKSNIVDWAEKLYGQSISAVSAGMKNLLSGGRQLALTRIVEALMEGKPNPEVDPYLTFDPRAPRSGSSAQLKGPFKDAIVFMIGGGNYVEYRSLLEMGQRSQPTKNVLYGTTELLNGMEFVEQLTLLGQKMGLGSSTSSSAPSQ